jgi:hypothetical protein
VQAIAFDLYDGENEPFDKVNLGIKGIYAAMVGGHKETEALTTLFSFITALKAEGADASGINALLAHHTISATFGIDDVADDWAGGETHTGGVTASLPLYSSGVIGSSYTLGLKGGLEWNALEQNRYIKFTGDGMPVTITSACAYDVDLYVHQRGAIVAQAETFDGNEVVTFNTTNGEIYVLNVEGYHDVAMTYTADIDIMH